MTNRCANAFFAGVDEETRAAFEADPAAPAEPEAGEPPNLYLISQVGGEVG